MGLLHQFVPQSEVNRAESDIPAKLREVNKAERKVNTAAPREVYTLSPETLAGLQSGELVIVTKAEAETIQKRRAYVRDYMKRKRAES